MSTLRKEPTPIALQDRMVVTRDGRSIPFDQDRIERAISLAMFDVQHSGAANDHRGDRQARYGLSEERFAKAKDIATRASGMLDLFYRQGKHPGIEAIQDTVEQALAGEGEWPVARSFALWRERKAEMRFNKDAKAGMSEYVAIAKYCRYDSTKGRRELWPEAVTRVRDMHHKFFANSGKIGNSISSIPDDIRDLAPYPEQAAAIENLISNKTIADLINNAFAEVAAKKVLPSMRSLQFGGEAILKNHARLYNCSYSPVDRVEFFREYFFLLLSGTGCGFSVQKQHVDRLPELPPRDPAKIVDLPVVHHHVEDNIEGWGNALDALMRSHYDGTLVEFDFSNIRPKGTPLKTSGGRAPGHVPLRIALDKIDDILTNAAGRKLRPIEVYDINMHTAAAVLSGGIRRSATIALFSADDQEMMNAKTGNWFETHKDRAYSNNSAVLVRSQTDEATFKKLFEATKQFGEPGFYFVEDPEYGCNPCCEIGLHPVVRGEQPADEQAKMKDLGIEFDNKPDSRISGWSMCNLSTVNAAALRSVDDFMAACVHATVIGTLQAAYTDLGYLGATSRYLLEREALLGVSICGFMDNPELLFEPTTLERGAKLCQAVNRIVSDQLGIRPAARITCTKPEGTSSLVLGSASGIHPHHSRRYLRRVTADRSDPLTDLFRKYNPHMIERSVYSPTSDVLTFPVEAPAGAVLKEHVGALELLDYVKLVQQHWVQAGTAHSKFSPGLHHNVSNTVSVKPGEWGDVAQRIWDNRAYFTGIALLADDGERRYAQAPLEAISSEADILKWNSLVYRDVPYADLVEGQDLTKLAMTPACAGGQCSIV